jgi:hypothetical protein
MATIDEIHDELEALNREREAYAAESRERALGLATTRNLMYREAVAKRDAIVQAGIADGRVVQVYDPDLLDKETLAVLEHMGTPVPPIDEVFPNGVEIPGKKSR